MAIALLAGAALATAVLSAVAGLGGGTVLIAVLLAWGMAPALALPLHAGVQLVANGSRSLAYRGHIRWAALAWFAIAALPGPFIVAPWVIAADPAWIRLLLAGFILLTLWPGWTKRLRLHGRAGLLAGGALVGCAGPAVGATGTLAAPFFLREDWRKEAVVATLAVAQSCGHALKIAAFTANGSNLFARWDLLVPMAAAVIVGTWIGRRLNRLFSEARFRVWVRALLFVLALALAWDGARGVF